MKITLAIIAGVLMLGTAASGGILGFHAVESTEALGMDLWAMFVYIGGGSILWWALRKKA